MDVANPSLKNVNTKKLETKTYIVLYKILSELILSFCKRYPIMKNTIVDPINPKLIMNETKALRAPKGL